MQNGRPDRALLGAVADIVLAEETARAAADQALGARIDDYGNTIETRFQGLERHMREQILSHIAALGLKDGAPGPSGAPGPAGPPGSAGPAGPPGPAGGPWTHRRHYDPAEHYRAGDVVAQDGGSSIALVDEPGPCPGDDWAALTLRGKPGQRGERGPAGERPVRLEVEGGVLVLAWADGHTLRCNLYPTLEQAIEAAA